MNITLDEIKLQCRIDSDDEDELLEGYKLSAIAFIEDYTNRTLYESLPEVPEDNAQEITPNLKIAVLMLIAYLYENRTGVNEIQGATTIALPPTVKMIIERYRFIAV